MVLLHLLHQLGDVNLAVVHIDHQLRGDESMADRLFVQQVCTGLGLDLHVRSLDVVGHANMEGLSLEEAGSRLRREQFEALRQELGFDLIATGQHRNDQLETLLINLYHGTGLHGLTGIGASSGRMIRPLLTYTRKEIAGYASLAGIRHREDASNQDRRFLRNVIRHDLIPASNSALELGGTDLVSRITSSGGGLDRMIEKSLKDIDIKEYKWHSQSKIALGLTQLPDYFSPIKKAIFDRAFQRITSQPQGISTHHFHQILKLLPGASIGKVMLLPGGIQVCRDRQHLVFFREEAQHWSATDLQYGTESHFPFFMINSSKARVQDHIRKASFFWMVETSTPMRIRPVRPGDRIQAGDHGATIPVNQVLQSARVAPHLKQVFPVLEIAGEIQWVPGIRTASSSMLRDVEITKSREKHCLQVQFQEGTFE